MTTTGKEATFAPSRNGAPGDAHAGGRLSLQDLARMKKADLERLYRAGRVPESLSALDGSAPGRVLAIVGPFEMGGAFGLLRRVVGSRRFPWRGKRFSAVDRAHGTGDNRVRFFGPHMVFPFETRIEASTLDGRPTILLDYELPRNPWAIQRIRDELREVSQGLFLGPAMIRVGTKPRIVLFFAVDKTSA